MLHLAFSFIAVASVRSTIFIPSISRSPRAFMASMSVSADKPSSPPQRQAVNDPTVQYVVVRRDLLSPEPSGLGWPTGSIIAQAVHASVAAVWNASDCDVTRSYCCQDNATQMHTVVLEAKNEEALIKLTELLDENSIQHVMWREQPENIVTALATKPYKRSVVQPFFKKFKLFK